MGCSNGAKTQSDNSSSTESASLSSSLSSDSSAGHTPRFTSESSISLDENNPFSYEIKAIGTGSLVYRLLDSPDAQFFTLDQNTGVLSAISDFDFEVPLDDNQDNEYELSVEVIDSQSRKTIQEFSLYILDVDEISTQIIFPPDGSNVGGSTEKLKVRGSIYRDTTPVTESSGLHVTVNGSRANFIEDKLGEWIAEIDIGIGKNSISAEVFDGETLIDSEKISIANNYIKSAYSMRTFGGDLLYGFSANETAVIEVNRLTGEQKTLLEIDELSEFNDCYRFSRLEISPNGEKLWLLCSYNSISVSATVFDIKTSQFKPIPDDIYYSYDFEWIDDKYFIADYSFNGFSIVDADSLSEKKVTVEIPDVDNSYFCGSTTSEEGILYLEPCDNSIVKIDLDPLLVSDKDAITVQAIPLNTYVDIKYNDKSLVGDTVYEVDGFSLTSYNLITGESKTQPIEAISESTSLLSKIDLSNAEIVSSSNENLYVKAYYNNELFELDINSLIVQPFYTNDNIFKGGVRFDIKPDSSEIAIYNQRMKQFHIVDMETYATNNFYDFTEFEDATSAIACEISYDWNEKKIYCAQRFSYFGTEASDESRLVVIDVENRIQSNILNGIDLSDILGESGRYFMGSVRKTKAQDELVFSVLHFESTTAFDPETGVFLDDPGDSSRVISYNMASGEHKILYEVEEFVQSEYVLGEGSARLSNYSDEFDAVGVTVWQGGELTFVKMDGRTKRFVGPLNPYISSLDSFIDSKNDRIFMSGFYPSYSDDLDDSDSGPSSDTSSYEIISVDMETGSTKIVSSNTLGNGIRLDWLDFQYDDTNDLLIGIVEDHLLLLDPNSGDRVLMPISGP